MVTGQRAVAVMSQYEGTEGKWLELDEWEKSFVEKEKVIKHKTIKHKIKKRLILKRK